MLQRFSSNRDYYHRKKVQAYHRDPFCKQWKYMVITSLPHQKKISIKLLSLSKCVGAGTLVSLLFVK